MIVCWGILISVLGIGGAGPDLEGDQLKTWEMLKDYFGKSTLGKNMEYELFI